MKHLIILGARGWLAGAAVLIALREPLPSSAAPAEGDSRPLELKRAIMGAVGRHLDELRVEAEKTVCAGAFTDPKGVLARFTTGLAVPVAGAALYATTGEELSRKGFAAAPPWAGESFFREAGSPWLKGRVIAVSLVAGGGPGSGTVDIRLPLQCDESGLLRTKAWAVVRLDLRRLLDRLGPELGLGDGESAWLAATPGEPLFARGPAGGMEARLAGLVRQGGPKGGAFWARMRSMPSGKLMCDGFDPEAFVFRRFMSEWVTLALGETPVLVVRETPVEAYTPPPDARTGIWSDPTGARLALLLDGSYCQVYLLRGGGPASHASGRVLDASLSARDRGGVATFQGEFEPDGRLTLSVYTDHAERGVTREVFHLIREKAAASPASALPGLRP